MVPHVANAHAGYNCAETFVLPSPSRGASGHWTIEPWREPAAWIAAEVNES